MAPTVAPPRTASVFRRRRLDRAPTIGALVAALRAEPRPFVLTGRWGLPEGAPPSERVIIAGVAPSWVVPAGSDPFDAFGQVGIAEPAGDLPVGAIGGGLVGWFGFDLSRSVERTLGPQPPRPAPLPAHAFGWYDDVVRRDPQGTWWVEALLPSGTDETAHMDALTARWQARLDAAAELPVGRLSPMTPRTGGAAHRAAVAETIERIRAGELFQANVCLRLEGLLDGDLAGLVDAVIERTDPWYGGWIDAGDGRAILSASPELFLRRRGREVTTGPIKGTLPRPPGSPTDPSADPVAAELLASSKDRAEHVMIVDLMRNDLGRVCEYGSIRPDGEPTVEPHAGVWHLVSTVHGTLHPDRGDRELLRATFPPGSVTGAPKVQALRVIAAVESTGREVYTGAHGLLSPVGGLDLAVTIRTIEVAGTAAWVGVGGGIVADSDPQRELDEALGKAAALLSAAGSRVADDDAGRGALPAEVSWIASASARPVPSQGLIETIAVRDGAPLRLAAHLARLASSAAKLGLSIPAELGAQIEVALATATEGRLRIELAPDRAPLVEVVAFTPVPSGGVLLSPVVVPGGLGAHKWRDRQLLADLSRVVDGTPLLLDADGAVLEASWANVWWLAEDGRLSTPRLDGRLLPGITRAALLAAAPGRCAAAPAPHIEALAARPLLLSSARGLTVARLASTPADAMAKAEALADELGGLLLR